MGETKPLKLSTMLSIAYSDLRADFREVRTSEGFLYIANLWRRPAKPNKANVAKAFFINNMNEKLAKQTQRAYPTCYQLITAILTAIFRKFGWKRRGSLSGIRAHGERRWHRGVRKPHWRTAGAASRHLDGQQVGGMRTQARCQ